MPVGTCGAMKGVHMRELRDDIKAQIILGNTYHLYLRPGTEILHKAGGLHRFGGWEKPILTDSGGFQVFSLSENRKLTEEGAWFRSHIDGSKHLFTPEKTVDIQRIIGSDIMMALDECPPGMSDKSYARRSLDLTMRWLKRGWEHFNSTEPLYGHKQSFFPIVQGCTFPRPSPRSRQPRGRARCRRKRHRRTRRGRTGRKDVRNDRGGQRSSPPPTVRAISWGVGTPANILEAIDRGVDMMDCVMPTRNGRNGMLFTPHGIMNMRNKKWADDFTPIQPDSDCFVDQVYTKAYLRHLFISGELLAMQIASIHNLAFYLWLVGEARRHIIAGDFPQWKADMVERVTRRL